MATKCKEKIRKEKEEVKKIAEERDKLKADLEGAGRNSVEAAKLVEMNSSLTKVQAQLVAACGERDQLKNQIDVMMKE